MDETWILYGLMAVLGGVVTVLTCFDITDKTGMSYHHMLVETRAPAQRRTNRSRCGQG